MIMPSIPRGSRFVADERGAVAATYAIAITALVAIAGVGFDYGRMVSLDTELQNGADQAALAGASQLDGRNGTCQRAADAVSNFVRNYTRFANDGVAPAITFQNEASCDAAGRIRFWQDKEKVTAADSDANAHFIEVVVDARTARYALTPIVGAFSAQMTAAAMAGLGSSVCKVPPIMICNPDPGQPFNADGRRGIGIVATGHSTGNSSNKGGVAGSGSNNTWSPGDFGFLQVPDDGTASGRNSMLLKTLAFRNPPIDCIPLDDNKVSTGNPQGLYDAINTRFDIYDFNSTGNGNVLATCKGGDCPSAPNVVKDFVNSSPTNTNGCKIKLSGNGPGWALPDLGKELRPVFKTGSTNATAFDDNGAIDVMGLPRDNCHYTSYNSTGLCGSGTGRFGSGVWDRADYFRVNHTVGGSVDYPPNWQNITRYETYLWELVNGKIPNGSGAKSQRGAPVCFTGTPPGGRDRRVLTVAVVSNCASLSGASQTVDIEEFADVFLVEPSIDDARRYNAFKDGIYMEIIGKSKVAGNGTYNTQQVRRDVPYLVR